MLTAISFAFISKNLKNIMLSKLNFYEYKDVDGWLPWR
jgi:hypothetical protein